MRIITIPPYRGMQYDAKEGHFILNELISRMRQKGQLEGVEIDYDEGCDTGHKGENRDEEFLAKVTFGILERVRLYCDSSKYDAIVSSGSMGVGLFSGRMLSKIPFADALHSAVHVASLIGDRFSVIETTDPQSLITRHWVKLYGLDDKLASVRSISRSSSYVVKLLRKCQEKERIKDPDIKAFVGEIAAQCIKAIEEERADTLILGCLPLQLFIDELRQQLDEAGYGEIQVIGEYAAAVEMAKAMVNMKLVQAARAYPSDALKSKPEFR